MTFSVKQRVERRRRKDVEMIKRMTSRDLPGGIDRGATSIRQFYTEHCSRNDGTMTMLRGEISTQIVLKVECMHYCFCLTLLLSHGVLKSYLMHFAGCRSPDKYTLEGCGAETYQLGYSAVIGSNVAERLLRRSRSCCKM